jgi:hypothetical protein
MAYSNLITFIWVTKRSTNNWEFNGWNDIKIIVPKKKTWN